MALKKRLSGFLKPISLAKNICLKYFSAPTLFRAIITSGVVEAPAFVARQQIYLLLKDFSASSAPLTQATWFHLYIGPGNPKSTMIVLPQSNRMVFIMTCYLAGRNE
jgi:hypothetical protein